MKPWFLFSLAFLMVTNPLARAAQAEIKDLSIHGGVQDGKARLVIDGSFAGRGDDHTPLLFATALQQTLQITREKHTHLIAATFEILSGEAKELSLTLTGEGDIKRVTGDGLQDWSVRQETNGTRSLVLRPRKLDQPLTQLSINIIAERELRSWVNPVQTLTLSSPQPALLQGFLKVEVAREFEAQPTNSSGLLPIELRYLPEPLRGITRSEEAEPLAFRFQGSSYSLPLNLTTRDPDANRVVLQNFRLEGQLSDSAAAFTLAATAHVTNPRGGSLFLLSGGVALAEAVSSPDWRVKFQNGRFLLTFDQAGDFPIRFRFNAAVRQSEGWSRVDFRVAPNGLAPVVFQGLATTTQFEFAGAARPERSGGDFKSFLPPDGNVSLAWKGTRPEVEGRLFYAAEMLAQIAIKPGLMRQVALIEGKVMQGELSQVLLQVRGSGNVTAVQGANVLAWKVTPVPNSPERRITVDFNQPQKETFALQVQMQTELGAFPQAIETIQLRPEGATRFAGHFRVVNEGAVRLEVVQATGLSQISPEQFPESDATKALLGASSGQRFAFRFSSPDFALRIQADNVLPELSVSELLVYHLGETETAIDAEFELDIREAPVREVLIRVPKGYAVARVVAAGLSDYFLREPADQPGAELRLVYGQPIADRQVIQLRLERNGALGLPVWTLPRVEVVKTKSTRGHLGVSADAGFRLTPDRTVGLSDIATGFFPRKVAGIQAAFRLTEPTWEAALRVERLPQSMQADVFHLFSIGEGIAYGSSTMNLFISGAPVSTFQVALSDEYFNVEFNGKDLRNHWQKTTNGYVVTLNTPVSGAYTLLVTYERPFKAQGDTLTFTGARLLEAQVEQGHTLVVSAYQFQVKPVNLSPGLLALETAEVPSEYRLFFDAPILAAYRYTARPFNLQLTLSPLQQGETLGLVVDRASLTTRISKDGEILTNARYFVKNRGNSHLRLALPVGTTLWSVTVNGLTVVPVKDGDGNLIPLPQRADANAVQTLDLKLASRSKSSERVTTVAPIIAAPVLLAEWRIEPDTGQRLTYLRGSLVPVGGPPDTSGFVGLAKMFRRSSQVAIVFLSAFVSVIFAAWAWRWGTREGAYRLGVRHLGGALVGCAALVLALYQFGILVNLAQAERQVVAPSLSFLAPVQQSNSALSVELANAEDRVGFWSIMGFAWPALIALIAWGYALLRESGPVRAAVEALGWTLFAWAALRCPNGGGLFFLVLIAFLLFQVALPALRAVQRVPRRPQSNGPSEPLPPITNVGVTAIALLLTTGLGLMGLIGFGCESVSAAEIVPLPRWLPKEPGLADSVVQEIRIEDQFAIGTAKIHWQATKEQLLPVLYGPAVLTGVVYPTNALKWVQTQPGAIRVQQLLALRDGSFDIELHYQVHIIKTDTENGFLLPTQHGLVNRLTLTLSELDVDVSSTNAVSVQRERTTSNIASAPATVATLVLVPVTETWIAWRPRSRDVAGEKAVFFAETFQLYVPAAGVIEGVHQIQIRPAQGELSELLIDVPTGATITDVIDPAKSGARSDTKGTSSATASILKLWRFDPDTRKLRLSFSAPQSRPFKLIARSQVATGPLPFAQSAGLLSVTGAAGQSGSVGLATGNEVQLDSVVADTFLPLNLEDFPPNISEPLASQINGLTLRRAFRYSDPQGAISLKASAVDPDVRVETQETLSLGEDRTVLAVNATVAITRAGIFRLSFLLPTSLDVESITGAALSHWTELKAVEGRLITLHFRGKTEGEQQLNVNLSGPGTKSVANFAAPRVIFREATKQRGQLVVVPEQGMRLQIGTREGVTQLDPQKSGIRQKGVLAFRLLQPQWALSLAIEQVDAWVQVLGLQHIAVSEAQVKVTANLQYQIENTGLKSFRVRLPAEAESVRFQGDQVNDFLALPGQMTNGMQLWEVKLTRRQIGKHLLQVTWQTPVTASSTNVVVYGVQAVDANLQRGFVTVQSGGRLQVRAEVLSNALQAAEWQAIPRSLRQDLEAATANFTFRLVEPAFKLSLALERHDAMKLLPARVNSVTLTSAISDEGVMLTQVKMELVPGDKRLLHFTLPPDARFWFAFVNQNGVWPWRDQDQILIPLEQQSRSGRPTTVELFYSSKIGAAGARKLDLELAGPKFDLPLENITWQVYLNDKWQLSDWSGTLQLQGDARIVQPVAVDVKSYLDQENNLNREKTRAAEEMLSMGNTYLEKGDQAQARRAFQSAFGLSTHDDAFNEDARVQLHNLKLQQAIIGLNVRQSSAGGESNQSPGNLRDFRNRKEATYTQQEAKQIIDSNTADENASLTRLAERLVQQQDAAVTAPSAIRAAIPEQGRLLTFRRAVQVDTFTDLRLRLRAGATRIAPPSLCVTILGLVFFGCLFLAWMATQSVARPPEAAK